MSQATQADPAVGASGRLVLEDVGKVFQLRKGEAIEAIRGVSFGMHENEVCVILGPSGCGKSTVLRMVAGLEDPTSGRLLLDGHEIEGPGSDRGMVFQTYTSFDWQTVQANVEYGMRLNGVPRRERRDKAAHYIELVGLTPFAEAYPKQLSGGMKQRVAIARTLANDPELVLMDEPFGALDAQTRWHMQELMMSIVESTRTSVLMVTHDIEEAIFLADRIEFMSRHPGSILEEIVPAFKKGKRVTRKEQLLDLEGFGDLERHVMKRMREQGGDEATPAEPEH